MHQVSNINNSSLMQLMQNLIVEVMLKKLPDSSR